MQEVRQGYERLADILQAALNQAQQGKGSERHQQGGTPFHHQPIVEIGIMVGPGGPAQQVMKKTQEAMRLPHERAIAELLGAINYAAATIIVMERLHGGDLVVPSLHDTAVGVAPEV